MNDNFDDDQGQYIFSYSDNLDTGRSFTTHVSLSDGVMWEEPLNAFIHFLSMVYGYDISKNVEISESMFRSKYFPEHAAGLSD